MLNSGSEWLKFTKKKVSHLLKFHLVIMKISNVFSFKVVCRKDVVIHNWIRDIYLMQPPATVETLICHLIIWGRGWSLQLVCKEREKLFLFTMNLYEFKDPHKACKKIIVFLLCFLICELLVRCCHVLDKLQFSNWGVGF